MRLVEAWLTFSSYMYVHIHHVKVAHVHVTTVYTCTLHYVTVFVKLPGLVCKDVHAVVSRREEGMSEGCLVSCTRFLHLRSTQHCFFFASKTIELLFVQTVNTLSTILAYVHASH